MSEDNVIYLFDGVNEIFYLSAETFAAKIKHYIKATETTVYVFIKPQLDKQGDFDGFFVYAALDDIGMFFMGDIGEDESTLKLFATTDDVFISLGENIGDLDGILFKMVKGEIIA